MIDLRALITDSESSTADPTRSHPDSLRYNRVGYDFDSNEVFRDTVYTSIFMTHSFCSTFFAKCLLHDSLYHAYKMHYPMW